MPEPEPENVTEPEEIETGTEEISGCVCYCVAAYRGAIAGSRISDPGFPVIQTNWLKRTRITINKGKEYFDGDVLEKKYDCITKVVTEETTIPSTLPRYLFVGASIERLVFTWGTALGFIPYVSSIAWSAPTVLFSISLPRPDADVFADLGYAHCLNDGVSCS